MLIFLGSQRREILSAPCWPPRKIMLIFLWGQRNGTGKQGFFLPHVDLQGRSCWSSYEVNEETEPRNRVSFCPMLIFLGSQGIKEDPFWSSYTLGNEKRETLSRKRNQEIGFPSGSYFSPSTATISVSRGWFVIRCRPSHIFYLWLFRTNFLGGIYPPGWYPPAALASEAVPVGNDICRIMLTLATRTVKIHVAEIGYKLRGRSWEHI